MRRRSFKSESGVILPIVIILMLALTITGIAFLNAGVMENKLARREVYKNQAFWLAEAGVEDARFRLGENWDVPPCPFSISGSLEPGDYNADIYDTDTSDPPELLDPADRKRRVRSIGTVGEILETVEVILMKLGGVEIRSPLQAGGDVTVSGNSTVNGEFADWAIIAGGGVTPGGSATIIPGSLGEFDDYSEDLSTFEDVFGVNKERMEEIAHESLNNYYDSAIGHPPYNDPIVENITWVEGTPTQSQIQGNWTGSGILIVNGDLKITGGIIFDGIIWVIGGLEVSAGTPVINGAVFVEGDTTVGLLGNLTLNYDADVLGDVFSSTGPIVESWLWL